MWFFVHVKCVGYCDLSIGDQLKQKATFMSFSQTRNLLTLHIFFQTVYVDEQEALHLHTPSKVKTSLQSVKRSSLKPTKYGSHAQETRRIPYHRKPLAKNTRIQRITRRKRLSKSYCRFHPLRCANPPAPNMFHVPYRIRRKQNNKQLDLITFDEFEGEYFELSEESRRITSLGTGRAYPQMIYSLQSWSKGIHK